MNIAFPALFLFILALPGIILRSSYREWGWEAPVYPVPLGDAIARSLFNAVVLHVIWYCLVELAGYHVRFDDVLLLLTGGGGLRGEDFTKRLEKMAKYPGAIAAYFVTIYAAAFVLGQFGRSLVRGMRLDLRWEGLRFDNFWYYVISGEFAFFVENRDFYGEFIKKQPQPRPLIFFSCVVTHGSQSFIYYGFPTKHYYDRTTGQLDRILLQNVTYQELCSPREEAKRARAARKAKAAREHDSPSLFEPQLSIIADYLILNRADIHNLSIQYVFFTEMTAGAGENGHEGDSPAELPSISDAENGGSRNIGGQNSMGTELVEAPEPPIQGGRVGNASAKARLGLAYAIGDGVPKDVSKAIELFREAAEQGHSGAQYNLGVAYETGSGVTQDRREAFRWYRKAAGQGDAAAQKKVSAAENSNETA